MADASVVEARPADDATDGLVNILLLTAHSVAEYDDVRMFSDLGYDVFSIGSYVNPSKPGDPIRPALPSVRYHADLAALVEGDQLAHKEHLPDDVIEWADTIICHHYTEKWLLRQWDRIRHKRIIWRTCGQSDVRLESVMKVFRADGLQIVRYSPKEEAAFWPHGVYAGGDALIRFGKYPGDYGPWIGDKPWAINISQGLVQRGDFTHPEYFVKATAGLPARAMGPGSEALEGPGALSYDRMLDELRRARVYVYTGTQPASYTLGLIEAMMSGVPVVSIGPHSQWTPSLFEGHELAWAYAEDPADARALIVGLLEDQHAAGMASAVQRARAVDLFDVATVGRQWREFLG